jgi:hypothetical protein
MNDSWTMKFDKTINNPFAFGFFFWHFSKRYLGLLSRSVVFFGINLASVTLWTITN